jgi:hypothetical protein
MDGSVNTLMIYVKFIGDSWEIFAPSDYLNVMLLKCDVKINSLIFYFKST